VDGLRISRWLLRTFSAGLWEELWFRGLCFGILCRAWGHKRRGLYMAALVQALLFGALHLTNALGNELTLMHVYQSTYAFLIGFGFAGLVAYCRSIWPAVLLHGAINAAGNMDYYFAGRSFAEVDAPTMVIMILLFLVFAAVPGFWGLRHAHLAEDK
jgi:membrane protease YdiL (CAAX protease family)